MNNLKFPLNLQRIIQNLTTEENRIINTIHGDTNAFSPEIGLPQGGKLSPLLWNLFYQPLLKLLDKHSDGFKINNLPWKITAVAYADDLTPVSTTKEDFQKQLDIIYSFLAFHGMKMNPTKSHILTNIKSSQENFPTNKSFKLGNTFIESIKEPTEITRILGTWISFDNNTSATRKHALAAFHKAINVMQSKRFEGPMISNLIQSTIVSTLVYRLQHVPITKTDAQHINVHIRSAIRKCTNLPKSTNLSIFQTKDLLINIKLIEETLDGRAIANIQTALRSNNRYGQFIRDMYNLLQEEHNLPLPLYEAPIDLTHKHLPKSLKQLKNTFFGKINNALHARNYSIKPLHPQSINLLQENMFRFLDPQIYATEFHKIQLLFGNIKLHNVIKTRAQAENGNEQKSKSIQEIMEATNISKRNKYLAKTSEPGLHAPSWLQNILDKFRNNNNDPIGYHESVTLDFPLSNQPLPRNTISTNDLEEIHNNEEIQIEIWTDGSHMPNTNSMGSAAIIIDHRTQETIKTLQCKPSPDNPSAQKAEIIAIIYALLHIEKDIRISIHTDSEDTIKALRRLNNGLSARDILKEKHYDLLTALSQIMQEFTTTPIVNKAKSKEDPLNAQADSLAKEARNLDTTFDLQPEDIPNYNPKQDLLLYFTGQKIAQYPIQHMKATIEAKNTEITATLIINKNIETHTNEIINTNATMKTAAILTDEEKPGDRANFKVLAYNINTLINHLETRDKLNKYHFIHDKETTCKRCNNEIEDNEHILKCTDTKSKFETIKARATIKLETEIEKLWDKNLTTLTKYQKPTTDLLWRITGITNEEIFDSPLAKGIITEALITKCKRELSLNPIPITGQKEYLLNLDIIILTIASFRTALYHEIWKPRTQEIFSENSKLEYEHKQEEARKRKEERKNEKNKQISSKLKRKTRCQFTAPPPSTRRKIAQIIIYKKKKDKEVEQPPPIIFKKKKIAQIIIYKKRKYSTTNIGPNLTDNPPITKRIRTITPDTENKENQNPPTNNTQPTTAKKRKANPSNHYPPPRKKPKITKNKEA